MKVNAHTVWTDIGHTMSAAAAWGQEERHTPEPPSFSPLTRTSSSSWRSCSATPEPRLPMRGARAERFRIELSGRLAVVSVLNRLETAAFGHSSYRASEQDHRALSDCAVYLKEEQAFTIATGALDDSGLGQNLHMIGPAIRHHPDVAKHVAEVVDEWPRERRFPAAAAILQGMGPDADGLSVDAIVALLGMPGRLHDDAVKAAIPAIPHLSQDIVDKVALHVADGLADEARFEGAAYEHLVALSTRLDHLSRGAYASFFEAVDRVLETLDEAGWANMRLELVNAAMDSDEGWAPLMSKRLRNDWRQRFPEL